MYSLSYILHITGVAIWVGSFLALGYLLRGIAKNERVLQTLLPLSSEFKNG